MTRKDTCQLSEHGPGKSELSEPLSLIVSQCQFGDRDVLLVTVTSSPKVTIKFEHGLGTGHVVDKDLH